MKNKLGIYEKQIREIFYNIGSYKEDTKNKYVDFTINGRDLVFDNLEKVSVLLGTKNINIETVERNSCVDHGGGYCYCGNNTEIEIGCRDVKF